jgi:hypothetical protein
MPSGIWDDIGGFAEDIGGWVGDVSGSIISTTDNVAALNAAVNAVKKGVAGPKAAPYVPAPIGPPTPGKTSGQMLLLLLAGLALFVLVKET